MSGVTQKLVSEDEDGMRLDRWFHVHFAQVPHGQLQKWLRKGQVRVEGGRSKANRRLNKGESVRIPPMPDGEAEIKASNRPLSDRDTEFVQSLVIFRDKHFIAINKPAGLAVQGGTRQERHLDRLLDGLKFDAPDRSKLVHRLDKDTSGVLMLARSRKAASQMGKLLKQRETSKLYWALVKGTPRPMEGTIDLPLGKIRGNGGERVEVCDDDDAHGQPAQSKYAVVASAGQRLSFVALTPITGRTHQLRVHMSAIGFPIAGDGKYGGKEADLGGEIPFKLHLHARAFSFIHPVSKRLVTVRAPLQDHMASSWDLLGFDRLSKDNPFIDGVDKGRGHVT